MNLDHLVLAVILVLVVALVFTQITTRLKLGQILGFLLAGVALGPYSPGLVLTTHVDELLALGELGVVFLMFTIGLEMEPRKLWAMRKWLFGLGPAQVIITGALIMGALLAISHISVQGALIAGFGLAMSSTAITIQVLADRGDVATEHGRATFAVLVMQDMAAVPLVILIPLLSVTAVATADATPRWQPVLLAVAAIASVVVVTWWLLPVALRWAARQGSSGTFAVIVIAAILAAAYVLDKAGMSMALGAFLVGVLLSASDFRLQVESTVLQLKGAFMGLFFIAVGMSIDIDFAASNAYQLSILVGVVSLCKVAALLLIAPLLGLSRPAAMRSAFLLAPCGEFGFVLFAAAKSAGLFSDTAFAMSLALVSLSMALTPFLVKAGYSLADWLETTDPHAAPEAILKDKLASHVVIAGYNRAGRLLCMMLEKTETPYIAFDYNLDRVMAGRNENHRVLYGNVADPAIEGAASLAEARAVAIMTEDMDAAERLVEHLHNFYPQLPIYMSAPDLVIRDKMRSKGVQDAVAVGVEGNIQLAASVLGAAGVAANDINDLIGSFRSNDYALIRGVAVAPTAEDNGGAN